MKSDPPEVSAARIEADRARAKLMATAHELQVRLSPATLARGAWQGAKMKGADIAEDAVDAVRARPLAASGAVAALALFLAREPLKDLAGKLADAVSGKGSEKRSAKPSKKPAKKVARAEKAAAADRPEKAAAPEKKPEPDKSETETSR